MNRELSMLCTVIRAQARIRTVISPKGRGDHLWEHPQGVGRGCKAAEAATTSLARPRGEYRDCFGDVVDMPQCVFRARRPSHRSSQVPPPNPLSLPDSGVRRNDVLNGGQQ